MFRLTICLLIFFYSSAQAEFYAPNSFQGTLSFDADIEIISVTKNISAEKIKDSIRKQILLSISSLRRYKRSGSFYPDYKITILQKQFKFPIHKIRYSFRGKVSLKKRPPMPFPIVIITNPQTAMKGYFHCMQDEKVFPFWYYWDPEKPGCNLEENVEYKRIQANIELKPHSEVPTPFYDKLFADNATEVFAIFGPDKSYPDSWDPQRSTDVGVISYRNFRKGLVDRGLKLLSRKSNKLGGTQESFSYKKNGKEITVHAYLGNVSILLDRSSEFQTAYKNALENMELVFYSGHAGMGYNLSINELKKNKKIEIKAPNFYQIIHLSTCHSYTHYAQAFAKWKSNNAQTAIEDKLDVISYAGGETLFKHMPRNLLNTLDGLLAYVDSNKKVSYSEILKKSRHGKALINIMRFDKDEIQANNDSRPFNSALSENIIWMKPLYYVLSKFGTALNRD